MKDDVLTSINEEQWYDAMGNMAELKEYCRAWTGQRWLSIMDMFSFEQGMKGVAGSTVTSSFDIRLDKKRHDITSKRGVFLLLGLGMAMVCGALMCCAPPCSMSVFFSCSVHKRHLPQYGPLGDVSNAKTRLSNMIVSNMVGVAVDFSFKKVSDGIYIITRY